MNEVARLFTVMTERGDVALIRDLVGVLSAHCSLERRGAHNLDGLECR